MIRVKELIKRDLIAVGSDATAFEASVRMRTCNVGSVFVREQGIIIGVVTESDVAQKIVPMRRVPEWMPVTEIMIAPVIGIRQDQRVFDAADVMEHHGTRHLAVTDENGIVGGLSVRDILHPVAVDDL